MKKCLSCGKIRLFGNDFIRFKVDKVDGTDKIKPGDSVYFCKKCYDKIEWNMDSTNQQFICETNDKKIIIE